MLRRFTDTFVLGALLGALAGCSDPVPAAVGVAIELNVPESGGCALQGPTPQLGDLKSNRRAYDGDKGLSASCRVSNNGGGFTFQANVRASMPALTFNLTNGTLDANGKGTALLSLFATAIGSPVVSPASQPCTITVVNRDNKLAVQETAIWARYDCPTLNGNPTPICPDVSGQFYLENCGK